jgi:hypothetical protein
MKKITLLLYLAILTANCSKKSEDNSFKNLFLLGYLSNTKAEAASLSEIVSLTAGVSIRQKLDVIEGQGINYTVSQTSSASSSMHSRDSLFDNRIVISLVDSDNKELYSTITIPGSSETLRYIPKKSGQFTAVITPFGNGTISTSIEGGSKANTLSSQNSVISAISGKRKYRITGAILQGAWVLINVDEVTSISADGRATFSPITDAIVTLTVDSTTDFSTTYNNNHSLGIFSFPFSGYANDQVGSNYGGNVNGRKLRLKVTHPTKSDISLDAEITAYPSTVTDVKINGISSTNGNGETLTIDKNEPITMTWKNATVNKPDLTQFQVNSNNNSIFTLLMPAENETFTVSKELLSGLTSSGSTSDDNCIGAIGGAGTASVFDTSLYAGLDSSGALTKSGFSIVNFDFLPFGNVNFNQPKLGFFCEKNGPTNPLTALPSGFPGGPKAAATFNSGGVPLLVIK